MATQSQTMLSHLSEMFDEATSNVLNLVQVNPVMKAKFGTTLKKKDIISAEGIQRGFVWVEVSKVCRILKPPHKEPGESKYKPEEPVSESKSSASFPRDKIGDIVACFEKRGRATLTVNEINNYLRDSGYIPKECNCGKTLIEEATHSGLKWVHQLGGSGSVEYSRLEVSKQSSTSEMNLIGVNGGPSSRSSSSASASASASAVPVAATVAVIATKSNIASPLERRPLGGKAVVVVKTTARDDVGSTFLTNSSNRAVEIGSETDVEISDDSNVDSPLLHSYFYGPSILNTTHTPTFALVDKSSYTDENLDLKGGLFGHLTSSSAFLNVSEPFSLVCVGRQGTGKSHTLNVVLENCMFNFHGPVTPPPTKLSSQMCSLVLHFDQSDSNVCEALGLHDLSPKLKAIFSKPSFSPQLAETSNADPFDMTSLGEGLKEPISSRFGNIKRIVVLVSPNYHIQRKKFYKDMPNVEVMPLRFQWSSLDASQLKKLMRLDSSDSQLYVSLMLSMLGEYQAKDQLPNMDEFFAVFEKKCSPEQQKPLLQRLNLLRSIVSQNRNETSSSELVSLMGSGVLIVCDLTDPMLSEIEVNAVFQVLLQQFRRRPLRDCGKVVMFDEAHKYLSTDTKSDNLSKDIVSTIRQMRHENIRVLLSTQSPLHLPGEAIELSTIAVLHEFQAKDWYRYIDSKLSLPENGFDIVKNLKRGDALVSCNRIMPTLLSEASSSSRDGDGKAVCIRIRERITTDCGRSMTHA